ncbi:helix-turn-helix domain-containing protein [Foetidibacter luteolus]|uniref:helix-turn-helix domain-containing protein n=1 Tax=Foetidibacter luteolus TaxID=2608880 RepID=UPI00129BB358|nr:helix-turn-helix domain-containing protein [Foetidibacter luteolus]
MQRVETIEDFYKRLNLTDRHASAVSNGRQMGHFNVYPRMGICKSQAPYNRRDFYKICLIKGNGILHFPGNDIHIDKPVFLLANPDLPYTWESTSDNQSGYFCLFKEDFLDKPNRKDSIYDSPLFHLDTTPLYFVTAEQEHCISRLFVLMLEEMEADYIYKYDLIRNYVYLLLHEAMKLQSADSYSKHTSASARITAMFIELLERQFPIDSPEHILQLKTANDFAEKLSVHVNHLNRAVKEITGKTTTEHISERITREAKALLRYADWTVAEIAYSLGFEYPAYFNNFFKKHTAQTPGAFRGSMFEIFN